MRLLVAEDEPDLNNIICKTLEKNHYTVDSCLDGEEALHCLSMTECDAAVLDVMMPKKSGVEVLRAIRAKGLRTPVLLLTAKASVSDRVNGLDAGADDYLTKPFSVEELLARLRVTERRLMMGQTEQAPSSVFVNGKLRVDFSSGCAYFGEEELHLTPIEYKLLCLLSKNVGKVLTHTYLTQNIWGHSWENDVASLRVFMATLRKKIEKNADSVQYIQTHVGVGYRMIKVE